jgi:hypothetical protein
MRPLTSFVAPSSPNLPHPSNNTVASSNSPLPAAVAPNALNSTPSPHPSPAARPVPAASVQPLRVYSRRHPRRNERAAHTAAAAQASPTAPASPASEFVKTLTKFPGGILPIPHVNKRRKKRREPPSREPRRSHRIAGYPATMSEVCPSHLKKQVMCALDMNVNDEREHISQQVLDEYAQCFKQPLPASHTKALVALFGWALPEADPAADLVECSV